MSILKYVPEFLYPKSRQFPFDEVCEQIVRAIEKRNWEVPGLTVEFSVYGTGEAKYRYVSNIIGDGFKLHFCRKQGNLGNYNDIAAVDEVTIPGQQISVYDDESGPSYYLYVGNDWEKDKIKFTNSSKVNSRLYGEPRMYLKYKGGWGGIYGYRNQRPPLLIHDNDIDREYDPVGDEPTEFILDVKFKEFTDWLSENVIQYILKHPEADVIKPFTAEKLIPYKGEWPIIYSTSNWELKERVKIGKKNPQKLRREDRHAYFGSGSRLVPLDMACKDKDIPEVSRDGFLWCDTNQSITEKSSHNCVKNGRYSYSNDNLIVAIRLKYANNVYVIDNAIFEETRKEIFSNIAPRDTLTNEELGRAYAARGKTIVPINQYKGDYKEPMVLINRELDFEEIEWVQEE